MTLSFAENRNDAISVTLVSQDQLETSLDVLSPAQRTWATASGFKGDLGQVCILPAETGEISAVLFGFGTEQARTRGRFHIAGMAAKLPEGDYELHNCDNIEEAATGWLLANYSFDRYKSQKAAKARLCAPDGIDTKRIETIANAAALAQDLINTPASDMGPDALEAAFREVGKAHKADIKVIKGDALLKENFPMIHAVGRASDQEPRLLDLTWGKKDAPKVTLVGKGVCFDTGGLNIKPGNSMGLMKKDMGGGANTIALAQMIMAQKFPSG